MLTWGGVLADTCWEGLFVVGRPPLRAYHWIFFIGRSGGRGGRHSRGLAGGGPAFNPEAADQAAEPRRLPLQLVKRPGRVRDGYV